MREDIWAAHVTDVLVLSTHFLDGLKEITPAPSCSVVAKVERMRSAHHLALLPHLFQSEWPMMPARWPSIDEYG